VKNLKIRQNEFLKRFQSFLRSLRFEDKVFLIFDEDVDGVTSGLIAFRALERMGIKLRVIPNFFVENKFQDLSGFDGGVIVDVPTQIQEKFLRKTHKKILVIDHHPSVDVGRENIFYINPRLAEKEIYQPASYVAYKIFSNFVEMKDMKWIAIVGSVGDYAFEDVKDLYKGKVKAKKKDIWKTAYGRAATRLNAAIALYGSEKSFGILKNCNSLRSLFDNKQIKAAHEKFSKEFWEANINVKKNSEFYPAINLVFAIVEPKYARITAAISSKISSERPNTLVLLAEKIGKGYKIHGRMQSGRIHVGELLKNFGGGGHRNAGACNIQAGNLTFFKERVIRILGEKK
jgi:single-stranded DNA-specific DHH superfamily exonuclease